MSNVPLPEPWSYCYTFETETSRHLSFSANKYNGMPPTEAVPIYTKNQLHAHAAAVSAAENARPRAELAKHQESEFHPDWSMLVATRESLAEHQQMIVALREQLALAESVRSAQVAGLVEGAEKLRERVKALEEALQTALKWAPALTPDEYAKCHAALKGDA
jgi:hypothetical protein